jgi:4-amino-4-deoxy-L-arabinose transferase-like glycosyltransferase
LDLIIKIIFCITTLSAYWALLCAWSYQPGREKSSLHRLDWAEAFWISLVALVIYTGWISVILSSTNRFNLINLVIGQFLLCLVLGLKFKIFRRPRFKSGTFYEIALGVLLVLSSLFYFRPHEYVLGGTDAGTYVNMSATIAKTGRLLPQGDWYKFLRDYGSITLRQEPSPVPGSSQLQFVGWHSNNENPKQLVPQFLPFHPALLAIGFSLFGIYGALNVTPLWSLLGVAAIYFFGRKLVSPALGLLSAFLFAITPVQVYFSRYPTTEPLTLLLIFTGLLAFLCLYDDKGTPIGWGVIGGASFGAALLTRIDLPLLIGLTLSALIVLRIRGDWSKGWSAFSLAFFLFFGHFLIQAALFSKGYALGSYSAGYNLIIKPLALNPTFLISVASILILLFAAWKRYPNLSKNIFSQKNWRLGLLISAAGLSLYAYFVRPLVEPVTYSVSWPSGNRFPIMNGENWVRMGWYLTPLGLILATTGFMLISYRESLARWGFFLLLGTLTTLQYTYSIMITPYHIYAMRRFMPIVIPTLIIFASISILSIWKRKYGTNRSIIGVIFLLLLAGGLVYQSKALFFHRDYPRMVDQIGAFDEKLDNDAFILVAESQESIFGDRVGPPLNFIFGHNIATVRKEGPHLESFLQEIFMKAKNQQKPLKLIAIEPLIPSVKKFLNLRPAGIFPLDLMTLQNSFHEYPSKKENQVYQIELYDVVSISPHSFNFVEENIIDIGRYDTPYLRKGFYGKEVIPGFPSMRWTMDEACIDVPMKQPENITVSIQALTLRPPQLALSPVDVFFDGQIIGRFIPDRSLKVFEFRTRSIPNNGISSLVFKTTTFNPEKLKISSDPRELGFLLDWVKFQDT